MTVERFSTATIVLYVVTILAGTITAFFSYKPRYPQISEDGTYQNAKIDKTWMMVSFVILWQLLAFSTCGKDTPSYNSIFEASYHLRSALQNSSVEPLFYIFSFLIRIITDNPSVYNAVLALVFLSLIYRTLYKLKNRLHFGWAILAFSTIFYLQYLNLKRIYIASAICFFGIPYLLDGKKFKYAVCVCVAFFVHRTSIIMLFPLVVDFFRTRKLTRFQIVLLALALFSAAVALRNQIFSLFAVGRYGHYTLYEGGFGMAQIIFHVPVLWLISKRKNKKDKILDWAFIFCIVSFCVCSLGYIIVVLGRLFVYFIFPFVAVAAAPAEYNYHISFRFGKKRISTNKLLQVCIFMYFGFRLYMYLLQFPFVDGIMPYTNIFGMIF